MICYLMVLLGQANPSSDAFGEWIDVALKHSPQIQAELQRQQAQREMVHLAAAWEDPKLKWTYMAESVETRVGPQEQRFGLEQKWVLPKKRAAEKAEARARVEAASATTQAVRAEVLAQVRRVYAQAFFLGQAIQLTQDHLQLLRDLETVIQQRYSVSKARYQDLIQVQLELDQLQVRIEDLQAQKPSLNADIEAALGQAHAWDYPLELPIVARDQMDHWLEMASAQLRETPMRLAAQSELEATQHQLESAQKTGLPDFMFGLEYVLTGNAMNPNTVGSGKDPVMLMVGINLPIWKGQNRAKQAVAAAQISMKEHQIRNLDLNQQRQFQKIAFQMGEAYRKRDLFLNRIIPQAQEALAVSLSSYQSESASYLELMDTERNLLTFLLTRCEAERDIWMAIADMEALLGVFGADGGTK